MVRRSRALWLAIVLVASLASAATSQPLPEIPVVSAGAHDTVLSIQVPIVGPGGSASTQIPIDGGILDIQVDPIVLPGPGGTVDVQAYLAQARVLLPGGGVVPLPSMVIRSEDRAVDGPAGQALAELAAEVALLRMELEALAEGPAAGPGSGPDSNSSSSSSSASPSSSSAPAPSDPPMPPAPPMDPEAQQAELEAQIEAVHEQVEALAAEAAWVHVLADQAAGTASAGIEEQALIAASMVARVEAGLMLIEQGIDAALASAGQERPDVPDMPESPSPSSSSEPSSASPTSAAEPPSDDPELPSPDPEAELAGLMEGLDEAQAQADEARAAADEAQAALAGMADEATGLVGEIVDPGTIVEDTLGPALEGAGLAAELAAQALAYANASAQEKVAESRAWLDEAMAGPAAQADEARAEADASREEAIGALEDAIASLQWASDWIAAVQEFGGPLTQGSLDDASRSLASANATAHAVLDILDAQAGSHGAPTTDDAQAQLDPAMAALAAQLAGAEAALGQAAEAADAAQADLAEALESLEAVPGQLEAFLDSIEPPGAPPAPGGIAIDEEAMAVCMESEGSHACIHYRSPLDSAPGSMTVLVAVPVGLASLGDIDSAVASVTNAPVPTDSVPIPPLPIPGLPGSSSSSSSASESSSESASEDPVPEVVETSSSTSSSSSPSDPGGEPHLLAFADVDTLGLRMGQQGVVSVLVRNDGTAADLVHLTAQSDAPITMDTTEGTKTIQPGREETFQVRITPTAAGSGTLKLFATGNEAATASDSVLVAIEAPPMPSPDTRIAASLEPTALQAAVGQRSPVTLRLHNEGSQPDVVDVAISGAGIDVEPASLSVPLAAGESAVRQVWLTAILEGSSEVQMRITSERGADLQPIVMLDAVGELEEADDPSDARDAADGDDEAADKKRSPGFGLTLLGAAVIAALLVARRRLKA